MQYTISVITPTIGRPASLRRLLTSLAAQTRPVDEVLIADGSSDDETRLVIEDPAWADAGLAVRRIPVSPPHAVRQREAAIAAASGSLYLLLDDDVELEPDCLEEMLRALDSTPGVVGVMADFNNQEWSQPTMAWRLYLRLAHGLRHGEWAGRVVGPLLRFGFNPVPNLSVPCEWLGSGNSLIRSTAFEAVGGFSDYFLHRSTFNEDVDLALRLRRLGELIFCPFARIGHFHDPGGRVSPRQAAEDDLYNRFHVLHRSAGRSRSAAFVLVMLFAVIESISNMLGSARRLKIGMTIQLLRGRVAALGQVIRLLLGKD